MPDAEFTTPGGPLRQSLLRTASLCLPSVYHRRNNNHTSPPLDFGTVFHAVAAEILRTLKKQGESQIPTEEAMAILREVYAQSNIVLPVDRDFGYEQLVWQVLRFCDHRWPTGVDVNGERRGAQIWKIEERYVVDVVCPDGITRQLTGQPDAIITDPPAGLINVDWKSGRAKPPEPRDGDFTREDGKPFLSQQGLFQLHVYGFMLMTAHPSIKWVILREFHTRWNLMREAKLYREELEHVAWEVGDLLMKTDNFLLKGKDSELWRPRPGRHCHFCPGKFVCEVPYDQRGEGSIIDADMALDYAVRRTRASAAKDEADKALKAYYEAGAEPPVLEGGHEFVGWRRYESGHRSWDTWPIAYLEERQTNGTP